MTVYRSLTRPRRPHVWDGWAWPAVGLAATGGCLARGQCRFAGSDVTPLPEPLPHPVASLKAKKVSLDEKRALALGKCEASLVPFPFAGTSTFPESRFRQSVRISRDTGGCYSRTHSVQIMPEPACPALLCFVPVLSRGPGGGRLAGWLAVGRPAPPRGRASQPLFNYWLYFTF